LLKERVLLKELLKGLVLLKELVTWGAQRKGVTQGLLKEVVTKGVTQGIGDMGCSEW
jgi:hypothetical protein